MNDLRLSAEDLRFIRTQVRRAEPLLAELYGLKLEEVQKIRLQKAFGEQMPVRLLQQLVAQRKEKLTAVDFADRSSPIALAEAWA